MSDNLALIVDQIFSQDSLTWLQSLIGVYSFAFQIFGDFAGYTFIAIGSARLLGIRLMTNFPLSLFCHQSKKLWRHWHISLSTWLRDYLYIPLGGNRLGKLFTLRNIMITLILGGLWQGHPGILSFGAYITGF